MTVSRSNFQARICGYRMELNNYGVIDALDEGMWLYAATEPLITCCAVLVECKSVGV